MGMTFSDFQVNLNDNLILNTDSYKFSHWAQLPPNTTALSEYLEARGGPFATSRFFGLQSILIRHLLRPVSWENFEEARAIVPEHMGSSELFNEHGWKQLIEQHGGLAPVEISAVPEGLDVPVHNVLMQVVNTHPAFAWFPTYIETLLQQVWGPTTVATLSAHVQRVFRRALERSSETIEQKLPFAIQDFGLRGVPSMESGAILGLAHLVNGKGTDTVPALREARLMYGARSVAGYSIPAGEHSEILAWSKPDGTPDEEGYLANLFDRFLRPGKLVAAPIDSYESKYFVEQLIGETFRERIMSSGGTFVARPDSGDPATVVPWVLGALAARFGTTRNDRGYAVLHPSVRVIFGDGMTLASVETTLDAVLRAGFSAENVTFGMGGGLLQKINRDIQRFAIKSSAIEKNGRWIDIRKVSSDDPQKASKAGRLALAERPRAAHDAGVQALQTIRVDELHGRRNHLRPVFRNGELLVFQQWDDDVLKTAAANPTD
jgi:nicotinamide phosphoribosyltransferase